MNGNSSHYVAAPRVFELTVIEERGALTPPKGVINLMGECLEERGTVMHSFGWPIWYSQVSLVCGGAR